MPSPLLTLTRYTDLTLNTDIHSRVLLRTGSLPMNMNRRPHPHGSRRLQRGSAALNWLLGLASCLGLPWLITRLAGNDFIGGYMSTPHPLWMHALVLALPLLFVKLAVGALRERQLRAAIVMLGVGAGLFLGLCMMFNERPSYESQVDTPDSLPETVKLQLERGERQIKSLREREIAVDASLQRLTSARAALSGTESEGARARTDQLIQKLNEHRELIHTQLKTLRDRIDTIKVQGSVSLSQDGLSEGDLSEQLKIIDEVLVEVETH